MAGFQRQGRPALLFLMLVLLSMKTVSGQGTRINFYSRSCPQTESIVRSTVTTHFRSNPAIAPGLVRMFFHDCFVHGCDASILIDGPSTEKTAGPNLLLRGFDVIDDAKAQLERVCRGTVSCADILALAVRDSVVLTGGPSWLVRTGRKDGRVSAAADTANLPSFLDSVDVQKAKFLAKGLNTQDLVALVGAHTIGTSACQFIRGRLFNFTASGGPDPTIDRTFLPQLQALCPANGDGSRRVDLDTNSGNRFDISFFDNLRRSRGIIESDQKLWTDASTRVFVQRFLGLRGFLGLRFALEFTNSMIKMGDIEVKTGTQGEVRTLCTRVN